MPTISMHRYLTELKWDIDRSTNPSEGAYKRIDQYQISYQP